MARADARWSKRSRTGTSRTPETAVVHKHVLPHHGISFSRLGLSRLLLSTCGGTVRRIVPPLVRKVSKDAANGRPTVFTPKKHSLGHHVAACAQPQKKRRRRILPSADHASDDSITKQSKLVVRKDDVPADPYFVERGNKGGKTEDLFHFEDDEHAVKSPDTSDVEASFSLSDLSQSTGVPASQELQESQSTGNVAPQELLHASQTP